MVEADNSQKVYGPAEELEENKEEQPESGENGENALRDNIARKGQNSVSQSSKTLSPLSFLL